MRGGNNPDTNTEREINMTCTACNGRTRKTEDIQIRICEDCGGLIGTVRRGDLHNHVDTRNWANEDIEQDRVRYFDLKVLGSNGVVRIHGWYDLDTKRIVQMG